MGERRRIRIAVRENWAYYMLMYLKTKMNERRCKVWYADSQKIHTISRLAALKLHNIINWKWVLRNWTNSSLESWNHYENGTARKTSKMPYQRQHRNLNGTKIRSTFAALNEGTAKRINENISTNSSNAHFLNFDFLCDLKSNF